MTDSRQISAPLSAGPVFVVGMWRSGTSLLYALLNQHPQIGLMYESDMLTLKPVFLLRRKSAWWLDKMDGWNGALTRHKIDAGAIDPNITDLPGAFRAVAHQYAAKKGATIWGCKSPNYYDRMNQLAGWFPSAKFIVIWRDPADVLNSVVRAAGKNSWFARPGMDLRALLGYRRMKQEVDRLERRGASVFQLQYDDLVADPASAMHRVCSFIGVSFDPRTASLNGADRSAVYDGDHHAMVKSSSIVAARDRSEVLSPRLKGKLERYVAYWRKQSRGKWPVRAVAAENIGAAPQPEATALERALDRVRYTLLRTADRTVPFAYAILSTQVWQEYRQMKSHRRRVILKAANS